MEHALSLLQRLAEAAQQCAGSWEPGMEDTARDLYLQELAIACKLDVEDVEAFRSLRPEHSGKKRDLLPPGLLHPHHAWPNSTPCQASGARLPSRGYLFLVPCAPSRPTWPRALRSRTVSSPPACTPVSRPLPRLPRPSTWPSRALPRRPTSIELAGILASPSCPAASAYDELCFMALARILRQASGFSFASAFADDVRAASDCALALEIQATQALSPAAGRRW